MMLRDGFQADEAPPWLSDIAWSVHELFNKPAAMQRFQEMVLAWHADWFERSEEKQKRERQRTAIVEENGLLYPEAIVDVPGADPGPAGHEFILHPLRGIIRLPQHILETQDGGNNQEVNEQFKDWCRNAALENPRLFREAIHVQESGPGWGQFELNFGAWAPPNLASEKDPDTSPPLPVPNRALSIEEKYVALAVVHDYATKGVDKINPWKSPGTDVPEEEWDVQGLVFNIFIIDFRNHQLKDSDEGALKAILADVKRDIELHSVSPAVAGGGMGSPAMGEASPKRNADIRPLADLLDRAGNLFTLAGKLGRALAEEHRQQRGQIDSVCKPIFDEFRKVLLELRDPMKNPPDGFEAVADELEKADWIFREGLHLTDCVESFSFFNTLCQTGWEAVEQAKKAVDSDASSGGAAIAPVTSEDHANDVLATTLGDLQTSIDKVASRPELRESFGNPEEKTPHGTPPTSDDYEDGTNLPRGTPYIFRFSQTDDWYRPDESKSFEGWKERWVQLRTRFEQIVDQYRPIACVMIEKRTPAYPEISQSEQDVLPGRKIVHGGGGLRCEPSFLFTRDQSPLFGVFPIRDPDGTPISNTVGEALGYRFGLFRQLIVCAEQDQPREPRALPGPSLLELARDGTALLYHLPPNVAGSLWRNWRVGFSRNANSDEFLWLDALFELSWQRRPGDVLHSKRHAWLGNTSIALEGEGLFPRLPDLSIFPGSISIPADNGYPVIWQSSLPDLARASVIAIDELLERASDESDETPDLVTAATALPASAPEKASALHNPQTEVSRQRDKKWIDFHTVKGIVEFIAAVVAIISAIAAAIIWIL